MTIIVKIREISRDLPRDYRCNSRDSRQRDGGRTSKSKYENNRYDRNGNSDNNYNNVRFSFSYFIVLSNSFAANVFLPLGVSRYDNISNCIVSTVNLYHILSKEYRMLYFNMVAETRVNAIDTVDDYRYDYFQGTPARQVITCMMMTISPPRDQYTPTSSTTNKPRNE